MLKKIFSIFSYIVTLYSKIIEITAYTILYITIVISGLVFAWVIIDGLLSFDSDTINFIFILSIVITIHFFKSRIITIGIILSWVITNSFFNLSYDVLSSVIVLLMILEIILYFKGRKRLKEIK